MVLSLTCTTPPHCSYNAGASCVLDTPLTIKVGGIMTFYMNLRQWRSVAEFTQHLTQHHPSIAPWARGVVLHHTVSPTLATWQGTKTMHAMANYYARLGWDRGPHLFIAVGSRSKSLDGIWQMTPLNLKGIHATTANSWAWGIEVVGNYDASPWLAEMHAMV